MVGNGTVEEVVNFRSRHDDSFFFSFLVGIGRQEVCNRRLSTTAIDESACVVSTRVVELWARDT